MLSMYVSDHHHDWDVAFPYITFAHNSSRHNTVGYSPFCLLIGREPTLLVDILFDQTAQPPGYAQDAITRADFARNMAHAGLSSSQNSQKFRYGRRHSTRHLPSGFLVLLWCPAWQVGRSEKLLARYYGRYRVLRQVTAVSYEIIPVSSGSSLALQTDVVHVVRRKPYRSPLAALT